MVNGSSDQLIGLYQHFKHNRYPMSGGLLDQPEAFLRAMNVIEEALQNNE